MEGNENDASKTKDRHNEQKTQLADADAKESSTQPGVELTQMENLMAKVVSKETSDSSPKKKKPEKSMREAPTEGKSKPEKSMMEAPTEGKSKPEKTMREPPTEGKPKLSEKRSREQVSMRKMPTGGDMKTCILPVTEGPSPRKKRTRKKDQLSVEKTTAEAAEAEEIKEKGKLLLSEMRSRRSRASLKKAKSPKKKNNDDCKTSVEIEKPPPSIREKLSKKASKFFATTTTTPATNGQQPPKEEKSVRQTTSIRERLKRGLKSAFSAFSKASFDKTVQNAKARMGYTAPKGKTLYDYQDTYLGGATEEEEEDEEDDDVEAFTDMTHRDDLVLVTTNNTNNGRIFNEKGRPFWKDKRFRSEIPKNDRKPLSSLLFLIADKKLVLKDPVNPPAYMEAVDQDLDDLMSRDKKHFNEEIVLSNTVRSIIATLDGLDEFAKNQPQTIKNLEMKEPKTAISYSRHFPQKNEEVPFEYSGLGVCRSAKKKKGRHRRSTSSSSSSSSTTSDKDVSSKRTKRRRKSRDKEGKTEMASSKERDKSSRSSRRKRRKKK